MGAVQDVTAASRRRGRRWRFGSVIFDEVSWTLLVDGERVAIEAKPLELLHELLLFAGQVVTKEDLLDAIWPDVSVVEASLPTAIAKLRRALGDGKGEGGIIETVARIGYRLAIPVELESPASEPARPAVTDIGVLAAHPAKRNRRRVAIAGALTATFAVGVTAWALRTTASPGLPTPAFTQRDAGDAIRKLDVEKIEAMLRAGWNPNTPFDNQGNGAMTLVLNICEWNPAHDKARLLLMARTLMEGGVRIDSRNKWGDTPYSIAKAKRYCGPDHPVTRMMWAQCYTGYKPPRDGCLATYERTGEKTN